MVSLRCNSLIPEAEAAMAVDITLSLICFFVAFTFLIVSLRNGLWLTHFWVSWTCLLGSVFLGILMLLPMEPFLDETGKRTLFAGLVLVVVLMPMGWIIAQHWQFWAELEAEALVERGRYDEAILVLQTKRVSEGATLLLLNDLAYCLDAVGEQEEALLVLDEAELRFGKQRELTVKRAVCLTRLGQTNEALAVMRAAVEAWPQDFELAYQFTVMFLKLDRRDDAERKFDQTEILYLREKSDEVRQQWRPKLERLRRQINSPS